MKIAVVDDEKDVREFIVAALAGGGHICTSYRDGTSVVKSLTRNTYDALILDWTMPGMDGVEVIGWVRGNLSPVPAIVVLTSRNDKNDIVAALEAGADDYIVKPETANVILARVNSVLRRSGVGSTSERFDKRGPFRFDSLARSVEYNGQTVTLTAKEFALARLFFDNLQRPLSREYIMQRVWNNQADLSTRTLDMHVSRLRTKLALRPESGYSLQTVFAFGYRLDSYEPSS